MFLKSPKETQPYITVLFLVSNPSNEKCSALNHLETVKEEMGVDRVAVRKDAVLFFAPSRYVTYIMETLLANSYETVNI